MVVRSSVELRVSRRLGTFCRDGRKEFEAGGAVNMIGLGMRGKAALKRGHLYKKMMKLKRIYKSDGNTLPFWLFLELVAVERS